MTDAGEQRRGPPWAVAAILVVLMGAIGCELPPLAPAGTDRQPIPPEDEFELRGNADAGEPFYMRHCTGCHGVDGQGGGPAAAGMDPPPTDFTAVPIPERRAYEVTRDGGQAVGLSRAMPAYRDATDDQTIRDVTAYTLQFYEADDEEPAEPAEPEASAGEAR